MTDLGQPIDAVWRMETARIVATPTRVVGDVKVLWDKAADARAHSDVSARPGDGTIERCSHHP